MNSSDGFNHRFNEEWGHLIYAQSINIRNSGIFSTTCRWVTRHGIWCIIIIHFTHLWYCASSSFCNSSFLRNCYHCSFWYISLKFENVHKPTLLKLAIPGSISAFIGAGVLTFIHGNYIKPFIALFY